MIKQYDLAIIGGGPAGCAAAIAAIHAAPRAKILLLEAGRYPRHKVCGEFLSPEGVEVLRQLGDLDSFLSDRPLISRARLFFDAQKLSAPIAPPAASITRYDLDFALWQLAESRGIDCRQESQLSAVTHQEGVAEKDDGWEIAITSHPPAGRARAIDVKVNANVRARAVINAAGRWSRLTQPSTPALSRSSGTSEKRRPGQEKNKWIGLKQHFREAPASVLPSSSQPSVDLYFFSEGYCGVQPIAPGVVNACAMFRMDARFDARLDARLNARSNARHTHAAHGMEEVFALHGELLWRSRGWQPASPPVSTSPLIFHTPAPLQGGILNVGDAAAFIDPFVGDGITLALRSGYLAGQCLSRFLLERNQISLAQASADYERRYLRELAPVFHSASQVRRLINLPGIIRGPLLGAIRFSQAAGLLVQRTRISA
jgi:flavin-dependent dehydrogenase